MSGTMSAFLEDPGQQILDSSLNQSFITQNGSGNMANIGQGGMMDVSNVTQTGNGNMVTVTQNVP